MIRRPPRSTQSRSSAASDVYKRQLERDLTQEPRSGAPGEFPTAAATEWIGTGSTGAGRIAHVLDNAENARIELTEHPDGLLRLLNCQPLRRGNDQSAVDHHGLRAVSYTHL